MNICLYLWYNDFGDKMEYVIIGMLGLVIILLIVLITRKNNNEEITFRLGKFETDLTKEIGEFKYSFSKNIEEDN